MHTATLVDDTHAIGSVSSRRSRIRNGCLALALAAASFPASADWEGKGELGFVLARGNTESTTLNAKADVAKTIDRWTHGAGFSVLKATTNGVDSASRYELHGQSNYALSDRSYVYGNLRYEDDEFSPFTYQALAGAGWGYKLIDTESTKLSTEVGAGYRKIEQRLDGESESDAVARGAVNFEHAFNAATKLYDKFRVESGSSNTQLENSLGVQVKMSDRLALGVDYTVRHNSNVTGAAKKLDQLTTANIVFAF